MVMTDDNKKKKMSRRKVEEREGVDERSVMRRRYGRTEKRSILYQSSLLIRRFIGVTS